jgi:glycosyltransferase involved in cell wall biosynthesis
MNFSVIIPAHNEEANIEKVINSLENNIAQDFEIVVIDDHCADNTADIVRSLAIKYKNIRLAKNNDNPGFANALKAGFNNIKSEIAIPVMADLCDDPKVVNKMYKLALAGFDIVCGSRYMKEGKKIGGPLLKTFFSRFVGLSLNFFVGIPTHDISNSFKLYKKKVLENIKIESGGFEISAEIPLKAYFLGFKITEIPTVWVDRKEGKSKFNLFKQGVGYLKLYLWALSKKLCRH